MSTFRTQYLAMFGCSTEQDFFDTYLSNPRTAMEISAAGCDPRLPRSAIGYLDTLLRRPAANVAIDAITQIRRHIPDFMAATV